MTKLTVNKLRVDLGRKAIISDVSITVALGDWICVIGPNGAGKSSLLKAIAGILPSSGDMFIDDVNLRGLSHRDRACWIAYVAQDPIMPPGMSVFNYVLLGRTAHLKMLASESHVDFEVAHFVITELGLEAFLDRDVMTLSGGERQRVAIARALTQASPIVLLDEPTTALDVGYQQEVLELIDRLCKEKKIAVISTMHDLTVAGLYPKELLLLHHGKIYDAGKPDQVLTRENIAEVYGANIEIISTNGMLAVIPVRLQT
jgi:iron complex transport system ATP-binding protein